MAQTQTRTTRELETRDVLQRPQQWAQADLLPEPDKQPGYVYRWIRVSMLDKADPRNITSKRREGWEPVALEEQPGLQLLVDPDSRFKHNIEIGGLLLCKAPKDFMDGRVKHFEQLTRSQAEAVDNSLMRQSDARMPLFRESRSTTSFGKGT